MTDSPSWMPKLPNLPQLGAGIPLASLPRLRTDILIRIVGVTDYATWGRPHLATDQNYGYPAMNAKVFAQMSAAETQAYYTSRTAPLIISYNGGVRANDPSSQILKMLGSLMEPPPGLPVLPGLPTCLIGPQGVNDLGDIFIMGGSVGGRNVLRVAGALTAKRLPIRMVSIWDAAFYLYEDSHTGSQPNFTFLAPPIVARESWNHFQTLGNSLPDLDVDRYNKWLRFKSLEKSEKHGPIQGLTSVSYDTDTRVLPLLSPRRGPADTDADFARKMALRGEAMHDAVYMMGEQHAWDRLLQLMAGRVP